MSEPGTLQLRLATPPEPAPGPTPPDASDPVALLRDLEGSGRFHRDSGLGRLFHAGRISLRENQPTDSLHLVIEGNRISAHVDRVSPLGPRQAARFRYSMRRAAAHNAAGMAQDLVRLLRGRQGDHRCRLDCEWTWDPAHSVPKAEDLLEPTSWTLRLEAQVEGPLDERRLRQAVAAVLGPLPTAVDPVECVDCGDDDALDRARSDPRRPPVPVQDWPPLRVCLAHHPAGDVVMLDVNHAAADGPAALRLLRSIANAYTGGDTGPVHPLDVAAATDLPVRPASAPVSAWGARYRKAVERLRDVLANPARLAADGAVDENGYGMHLVRLSTDDTRLVVDPHRRRTSRDVMVAALHLAIGDWNLRHGTPGRRVGVLVPVDLRPPRWPDDRIGNFSVTARVSTSRRHRSGPEAALRAIVAQSDRNRRTRTGTALLAALDRARLVPLWTKQSLVVIQPLTRNRLVDTAMVANLGRQEEPPSFGAEAGAVVRMWYSVPARTPVCLTVGAVTLAGRLHLSLRYPYRLFDAEAAGRFADCYLRHLRSVGASRGHT
jgi:NRPS condensation-like uncharacterized protein